MNKIKMIVLFVLLCLLTACGQNTPTLVLERENEVLSIPGQADVVTKYRFMGDVNYTQEICHEQALEPVKIELTEDSETATLVFSCEYTELTVQKELLDWTAETFQNMDTIVLEPGCRYAITGVFRDGKYEYHMDFADIEVADTEETAAIKREQQSHWDYVAKLVYNGEKYRNTDGEVEILPEGYELLGATHETEVWNQWDGETLWATFQGAVYGKAGETTLYATIPWEHGKYIAFIPEAEWETYMS